MDFNEALVVLGIILVCGPFIWLLMTLGEHKHR